jgi:hypothetical protein
LTIRESGIVPLGKGTQTSRATGRMTRVKVRMHLDLGQVTWEISQGATDVIVIIMVRVVGPVKGVVRLATMQNFVVGN